MADGVDASEAAGIERVTVARVAHASDEVRALIAELEDTLAAEYPPEQRHGLSLAALFAPHVRFFVAQRDGVAVGCGAIALFDGFAEVKRMYVRSPVRGRGIARRLLARLEAEALACGRALLRLETGTRQQAAVRMYERYGFRPCAAFGAYASMPEAAIAASLFYEKVCGATAGADS